MSESPRADLLMHQTRPARGWRFWFASTALLLLLLVPAACVLGRLSAAGEQEPAYMPDEDEQPLNRKPVQPVIEMQAPPAAEALPSFDEALDPPIPIVAIQVRVAACSAAGQELEYHLCVANCSEGAAHHVLVRDTLPANACFVRATPAPVVQQSELLWALGTLAPHQVCTIVLVLAPGGPGDVINCARVQFEHGECVCTKIAQSAKLVEPGLAQPPQAQPGTTQAAPAQPPATPRLQLQKSGPASAVVNDTLTYQLTINNVGTGSATQIVLTDALPEGIEYEGGRKELTWTLDSLAAGQSETLSYQATAKRSGRWCNHARALAAAGVHAEAESCVTVEEPKLTLTKTGPPRQYANLPVTYQLTVANSGTVPLDEVVVTDPIPAGARFVSATNGGQLVGQEVQWTVGALAPGERRALEIILQGEQTGRICNRAIARASRGVSAQVEMCTEFVGVAALLLEVVDTEDPVEVGAQTSYVILVRNQGSDPATNVRIAAQVPPELTVVRAAGPADNHVEGQRLTFQPIAIPPQTDRRYEVYVKGVAPGDARFKVELTADQLTSGPVHEEESTTVYTDLSAGSRTPTGAGQSYRRHR